jgi:hypothetical protein
LLPVSLGQRGRLRLAVDQIRVDVVEHARRRDARAERERDAGGEDRRRARVLGLDVVAKVETPVAGLVEAPVERIAGVLDAQIGGVAFDERVHASGCVAGPEHAAGRRAVPLVGLVVPPLAVEGLLVVRSERIVRAVVEIVPAGIVVEDAGPSRGGCRDEQRGTDERSDRAEPGHG